MTWREFGDLIGKNTFGREILNSTDKPHKTIAKRQSCRRLGSQGNNIKKKRFTPKTIVIILKIDYNFKQKRMNDMDNKKVFSMSVAKVYPMLVAKAQRKGRTKDEVDKVCCWLTGYTPDQIEQQIAKNASYETFFLEAPQMNANCHLITGSVCGIKVESIEDPLMQKIRWLDKLVDELAKGKSMDKILRNEK